MALDQPHSMTHLGRVREICSRLAGTTEKLSHGSPTFFVAKRVYLMFVDNHHNDGHIGVWIPLPPGMQGVLIHESAHKFYRPPYVGGKGWVGIELTEMDDDELAGYIGDAWKLIRSQTKGARFPSPASAR